MIALVHFLFTDITEQLSIYRQSRLVTCQKSLVDITTNFKPAKVTSETSKNSIKEILGRQILKVYLKSKIKYASNA